MPTIKTKARDGGNEVDASVHARKQNGRKRRRECIKV
jgi:hypothetical protein